MDSFCRFLSLLLYLSIASISSSSHESSKPNLMHRLNPLTDNNDNYLNDDTISQQKISTDTPSTRLRPFVINDGGTNDKLDLNNDGELPEDWHSKSKPPHESDVAPSKEATSIDGKTNDAESEISNDNDTTTSTDIDTDKSINPEEGEEEKEEIINDNDETETKSEEEGPPIDEETNEAETDPDTDKEEENIANDNETEAKTEEVEHPREIEWSLSYETTVKMDGLNKARGHYQAIFSAFDCKSITCKCKQMDIQISIDTIHREIQSSHCDHLKFSILPGIQYQFHIQPVIEIDNVLKENDIEIIAEPKIYEVSYPINAKTQSFELALELNHDDYDEFNRDTNKLSAKLLEEVSEFVSMKQEYISIMIDPPYDNSGSASIKIIIAKTLGNKPQTAIEKIKNIYYDHDTESMLLSDIIAKSKLLRVTALTTKQAQRIIETEEKDDRIKLEIKQKETSHATDIDGTQPAPKMTVGAWFVLLIVVAALFFLLSRYLPDKFEMIMDFCKVVCIMCIQEFRKLVSYAANSSYVNNWSLPRPTPRYDVLNISEEFDAAEEDDIPMMNSNSNESGIDLLHQVFEQENVASFTRERYIRVLRDNWITTIERLKQLNKEDWVRFGIPKNIQTAILNQLQLTLTNNDNDKDIEKTSNYKKPSKPPSRIVSDGDVSSNLSHELEYPNELLTNKESPTFDVTVTDERTKGTIGDVSDFSDF